MTRIQAKQALENTENVLVRGLRGTISDINTFPPSGGPNTGCEVLVEFDKPQRAWLPVSCVTPCYARPLSPRRR